MARFLPRRVTGKLPIRICPPELLESARSLVAAFQVPIRSAGAREDCRLGAPVRNLQQWRLIATIERHASPADSRRLISRELPDVRLERVAGAPPGCRGFDVLIDACEGDERYARAASVMLCSLHRSMDAGGITELCLVDGQQRLTPRHGGAADATEQ